MLKKQIVDFVIACTLIIIGSLFLILPMFKQIDVRFLFVGVICIYGILNLTSYILTISQNKYYGLLIMITSILVLVLFGILEAHHNQINMPLTLFTWMSIIGIIKLSDIKCYHNVNKSVWIFRLVGLVILILIGLLTVITLYLEREMQVIILGYFYFIIGVLELVEPITNYLLKGNE